MNKEVTRREIDEKYRRFCNPQHRFYGTKACQLCEYNNIRVGDCKTQWILDNYNVSRKDNKNG